MINIKEAESIAIQKINKTQSSSNIELDILKEETISFEFGWMFFYQSKEFIRTKDSSKMVGGNAPLIVDRLNSSVHVTGTSKDEDFYIELYKKYRNDIDLFNEKKRL